MLINTAYIVVILACIVASIFDSYFKFIFWPNDYGDTIGVSLQVITAILSLVASIIGIAISLQNEEIFGVKFSRLYALRVKKYYSILTILLSSVFLCGLHLCCYLFDLKIACLGITIVSFIFVINVLTKEVPIMSKDEGKILELIKDNYYYCVWNKMPLSKELKDAIQHLLYVKNFKEVYYLLYEKNNKDFNSNLIIDLLDIQQFLAFEIRNIRDENKRYAIASSLLENVCDIVFNHIALDDDLYQVISNNQYLLTRVFFRVYEMEGMNDSCQSKIRAMFRYLEFKSIDLQQIESLVSNFLITILACTVQDGDFKIIKAVRHQLSSSRYCLIEDTPALIAFAVVSMYLFYLEHCDDEVPAEIKNKVHCFISESGEIVDKTKIRSWKELFVEAAENFNVNYNEFSSMCDRHENTLGYYLFGNGAKSVVLTKAFYTKWYLANLFNSERILNIDYVQLCEKYPELEVYLVDFANDCIDDNQNFVPNKGIEDIARYYSDSIDGLSMFQMYENRKHHFFDYINNVKKKSLSTKIDLVQNVDFDDLQMKIIDNINSNICNEWGYNSDINIDAKNRYFSAVLEMHPEAINFESSIISWIINSVFSDIKGFINITEIYNDDNFDSNIHKIIDKSPKYSSFSNAEGIWECFIVNEELKDKFISMNKRMTKVNSKLLNGFCYVLDDSFNLNFELELVEIKRLSEEQISKKIESYRRADGLYVYEGVFLTREDLVQLVEKEKCCNYNCL